MIAPQERAAIARRVDHANVGYGDDWLISAKHAFQDRARLLAALVEVEAARDDAREIAEARKQDIERLSAEAARWAAVETLIEKAYRKGYDPDIEGLAEALGWNGGEGS